MTTLDFAERRRHVRVALPFPATVEGTNDEGHSFESNTVTDDMSAGGVYLRMAQRVPEGSKMTVTAKLSVVPGRGMMVRLQGKVLRVEEKPGRAYGVAIELDERKVL